MIFIVLHIALEGAAAGRKRFIEGPFPVREAKATGHRIFLHFHGVCISFVGRSSNCNMAFQAARWARWHK